MRCTGCGSNVALASGERVGFRDTCSRCGADLHACRNCAHHDPAAYNECRETSAERVSDRERANRCDYFAPREGGEPAGARAPGGPDRSGLDALFRKR